MSTEVDEDGARSLEQARRDQKLLARSGIPMGITPVGASDEESRAAVERQAAAMGITLPPDPYAERKGGSDQEAAGRAEARDDAADADAASASAALALAQAQQRDQQNDYGSSDDTRRRSRASVDEAVAVAE
jgi:hypothetical protein